MGIKHKYGGVYTRKTYKTSKEYVAALKKRAENLWKKVGKELHGNECEVQKYFPQIRVAHTPIIQGEHCITRANKHFFFDINNHSSACSTCNMLKKYGKRSISRAINEIVRNRNPVWYDEAVRVDQSCAPNIHFSKVWWLEDRVSVLNKKLNDIREQEIKR